MATNQIPGVMPTHFTGRRIKFRVPYTMPGELIVPNGTAGLEFPEAAFLHNIELPFEIWDMSLHAAQLDPETGEVLADPLPDIDQFWRLRIQDVSKNQAITKNAQLAAGLKDTNTDTWFWRYPYTIVRAEGFQVSIDNLLPDDPGNELRTAITFRGYLIVLSPASETR